MRGVCARTSDEESSGRDAERNREKEREHKCRNRPLRLLQEGDGREGGRTRGREGNEGVGSEARNGEL